MLHEQLTENDVKKIKEEIEYRKLTVRKNAIEAVKEARAHGDLSENFEYHAAKKDKNMSNGMRDMSRTPLTESEIEYVKSEIERIQADENQKLFNIKIRRLA